MTRYTETHLSTGSLRLGIAMMVLGWICMDYSHNLKRSGSVRAGWSALIIAAQANNFEA